jgi:hypothetical protein
LSVGIPVGVLLLLAIGGAILGAVAYGEAESEMYALAEAEQQMTATADLIMLRSAVEAYRLQQPTACPTFGDLVAAGVLTPDTNPNDPWGWPYVIDCSSGYPNIYSVGPDGTAGTYDDISN